MERINFAPESPRISESIEESVVNETNALDRFKSIPKLAGIVALALASTACVTTEVGGSIRTVNGVTIDDTWRDTVRTGKEQIKIMCNKIRSGLESGRENAISSTHTYKDGSYKLNGLKLPSGQIITENVTLPNGAVYKCPL